MYLTEWYFPDNYNNMSDPIKLYHGTDIEALNNILEDGVICAKRGRCTGETKGVNWFFVKNKNNFSRGSMFSIEVPKSMFENGQFLFMNDIAVTSRDNEIPIEGLNFRIETIGGADEEVFMNIYKIMKEKKPDGDLFDWYEMVKRINREFKEWLYPIDMPVCIQLIKQLFGENTVKEYGLTESYIHNGYLEEVEPDEVNLDSFKVKDELQPDIWVNGKINSDVRKQLLEIAQDFIDDLEIRWVKPKDIIITGSIANYNWSEYSDIDLHIVMKFSDIHEDVDLLTDYFKAKKDIWNEKHTGLTIFGFPVEVYVQDLDEPHSSSGVFSLISNDWLVKPKDLTDARLNKDYIKSEAAKIMTKIDDLCDSDGDEETIMKKAEHLMDYAKDLRKKGLATDEMEMSSGNIIWKTLRREGYIERLADLITSVYDKINSID